MHAHFCLIVLILTLALDSQVYAGRIIGGQEAAAHSRPYMARFEIHGSKNICSGFLLNEEFVMTAAHCQNSSMISLGFHDYFHQEDVLNVPVEQAFPHEDFNPTTLMHDIMLLKLSSKVNYSKKVQHIPLAGEHDGHPPQSCSVAGWGQYDKTISNGSPTLMEASVTLIKEEECKTMVCEKSKFKDECKNLKVYCSNGDAGPRPGDSGGPLVCDGKAYGVVSFGDRIPDKQLFCTYTKIPDYRSWIDETMESARRASV